MNARSPRPTPVRIGLAFAAALLATGSGSSAQQWQGAADPNGDIHRPGNVGIGTSTPTVKLDVAGSLHATTRFRLVTAGATLQIHEDPDSAGYVRFKPLAGLGFFFSNSGDQPRLVVQEAGNVGIGTSSPAARLDVAGTTRTQVLQITGGSDLAEPFEIAGADGVRPGLVVSVDPRRPGGLRLSAQPYDRAVVGVVSGAGGIDPGMVMGPGQERGDGRLPVALTGRVYVWADTSEGPIAAGDLLTTSARAGFAARVADFGRAQGATLGKAMTALPSGEGLVLLLVSLQ